MTKRMNTQTYFIIGILIIIGALNVFIFMPFLQVIALALVFSVVCQPLYEHVLRFFRGREGVSAFITTLLVAILFFGPLIAIGVQVFRESVGLYNTMTEGGHGEITNVFDGILEKVYRAVPSARAFSADIDQYLQTTLRWIIGQAGGLLSSIGHILFSFLIFFVTLYYFFRDRNIFKSFLTTLSPLSSAIDKKVITSMNGAINSVIGGSLAIAIIQGVLVCVGFLIFGVPNPVLWGMVAAFSALIPTVGTSLVLVPGAAYLFFAGHTLPAVGLILWGTLLVGLIDNFLAPRLIGHSTDVHPLIIFFSVLGGISFFGPAGFILGPLSVSLLFALTKSYVFPRMEEE